MIKYLLLLITIFSLHNFLFAQVSLEKIQKDEVRVYNESYMEIDFYVSQKKNRWKKYHLEAGEQANLVATRMQVLFKISTPGLAPRTVIYRLEGGKHYDIFWFAQEKRLDITELMNSGPASLSVAY